MTMTRAFFVGKVLSYMLGRGASEEHDTNGSPLGSRIYMHHIGRRCMKRGSARSSVLCVDEMGTVPVALLQGSDEKPNVSFFLSFICTALFLSACTHRGARLAQLHPTNQRNCPDRRCQAALTRSERFGDFHSTMRGTRHEKNDH